jgi:hypothetical protein
LYTPVTARILILASSGFDLDAATGLNPVHYRHIQIHQNDIRDDHCSAI